MKNQVVICRSILLGMVLLDVGLAVGTPIPTLAEWVALTLGLLPWLLWRLL